MRTFLGLESPVAIAHRGGAAEHPENTMAAFEHAVKLGYPCIETDVRSTRDGVAMVFHDENLDRLTDHTGPLVERDWAQLDDVRIAGKEPIVRLDELLGAWPDLRLIIDPKSDDVVTPLIDVLRRTNARDRVCIGSFSARRLRRIRDELPGCTSCSPAEVVRLRADSWGVPTGKLAADCAQVPPRHPLFAGLSIPVVDAAFLRSAHARGMPVQVWTVNDDAEMAHVLDLGADGIMSDRVTALKDLFEQRGLWR